MNNEDKLNNDFKDYLDADAPATPDICIVSETVYERLFDMTFGYLISSVSAFFFLLILMPVFFILYAMISAGNGKPPELSEILVILNPGWLIGLILTIGFFTGGVALFNSMRAGRVLLKYLFMVWGLIMLFELKYFMDRASWPGFDKFLMPAFIVFLIFVLIYMIYRSYRNKDVGLMLYFNVGAITVNLIMIVRHFISFRSPVADRHIQYLSMFFIAAILMQTIEAAKTFFPFVKDDFIKIIKLSGWRKLKFLALTMGPFVIFIAFMHYFDHIQYYAGSVYYDKFYMLASTAEDLKRDRAKNDCRMLAAEIRKYNKFETGKVLSKDMNELEKGYIKDLKKLKDPWGGNYEHDCDLGIVYSKGPDQRHAPGLAIPTSNKDDICVSYTEPLVLTDAKLEVNPEAGDIKNPAQAKKCYDVLHLYFNKDVALPGQINLGRYSMKYDDSDYSSSDYPRILDNPFFYYDTSETGTGTIPAPSDLYSAAGYSLNKEKNGTSEKPYGYTSWGADSKEIIIRFADGYTCADPSRKLLVPGVHYINLTGCEEKRSWHFKEFGRSYSTNGAVEAPKPLLIKKY